MLCHLFGLHGSDTRPPARSEGLTHVPACFLMDPCSGEAFHDIGYRRYVTYPLDGGLIILLGG